MMIYGFSSLTEVVCFFVLLLTRIRIFVCFTVDLQPTINTMRQLTFEIKKKTTKTCWTVWPEDNEPRKEL